MEALLESIKQMNRLMLPYLKQDTYEEFMAITHHMIACFNERDTQHVDKKLNDMFQEMQNNALYKSQLEEAQSKMRTMECEISMMRGELALLRSLRSEALSKSL